MADNKSKIAIRLNWSAFAYEAKATALNEGEQMKKMGNQRASRVSLKQPIGFEVGVFISSTTFLYVSLILITLVWS